MYDLLDYNGNPTTWDWVHAQGFTMQPADVAEFSGLGYHLKKIQASQGAANLYVQVLGATQAGLAAARWWPGLSMGEPNIYELPANIITPPGGATSRIALCLALNSEGVAGFGVGTGDLYGANGMEAYLSIPSHLYPSTRIRSAGAWLAGTDHYGMLRYTFEFCNSGEEPPPPPPPPPGARTLHDLAQEAEDIMSSLQSVLLEMRAMIG